MLRTAQGANGSHDARVHIGAGAGNHASCESRRVELVLRIEVQGGVHRAHPGCRRRTPVQQMQEVPADRVVLGLDKDPLPAMTVVKPVRQHRPERGNQLIRDRSGTCHVVVVLLRHQATQSGSAGAEYVHGMGRRRQRLEDGAHCGRQPAHRSQPDLVLLQLHLVGETAVHQQVRDLLELARGSDLQNVIAAIVQIVAGAADGAQRGVASRHSGERDRLLGFGGFSHGVLSRTTHPASLRRSGSRARRRAPRASASGPAHPSECRPCADAHRPRVRPCSWP